MNTIVGTQLLPIVNAAACSSDNCPSNTVDVNDADSYNNSDGPNKFQNYTFMILGINLVGMILFTPFLPKQKEECHEWRKRGEAAGYPKLVGYASFTLATCTILYGIIATVMLVNPNTACLQAIGGSGCNNDDDTGDDNPSAQVANMVARKLMTMYM